MITKRPSQNRGNQHTLTSLLLSRTLKVPGTIGAELVGMVGAILASVNLQKEEPVGDSDGIEAVNGGSRSASSATDNPPGDFRTRKCDLRLPEDLYLARKTSDS